MSRTPSTSLRERKKAATRERLLASASALFAEHGYDTVTMDDIAERAGVSRATAFNYVARKEDFLYAAVESRRDAVAALLAREQSRAASTAERLDSALMALCDMLERD